jgi:hypothetical protein
MWTKEHRAKAAARTRKFKRYPSDLTDDERSVIAPLMPAASHTGRPRGVDLREVINAIRYLVRSGCEWRAGPLTPQLVRAVKRQGYGGLCIWPHRAHNV